MARGGHDRLLQPVAMFCLGFLVSYLLFAADDGQSLAVRCPPVMSEAVAKLQLKHPMRDGGGGELPPFVPRRRRRRTRTHANTLPRSPTPPGGAAAAARSHHELTKRGVLQGPRCSGRHFGWPSPWPGPRRGPRLSRRGPLRRGHLPAPDH